MFQLYLPMLLSIILSPVSANVVFDITDPDFFRFGETVLNSCGSVTLSTAASLDPLNCAHECSSEERCHAFLWSEGDHMCSHISTPCKPTSSEVVQMVRRQEHPTSLTWYFKGSKYILTKKESNFAMMHHECAQYGMYLWAPETREEMRFVEQNILSQLSSDYKTTIKGEVEYNIWIGVIIRDEVCFLSDLNTKCPIRKAFKDNVRVIQDCVQFVETEGHFQWKNVSYFKVFHGLCEGRYN